MLYTKLIIVLTNIININLFMKFSLCLPLYHTFINQYHLDNVKLLIKIYKKK